MRTAHTSNEVSNNSSLRSESHTNQPVAQPPAEPQDDAPPGGVERPDWALLDACLPAPVRHGLSTATGKTITTGLNAALGAGWTQAQIYRALNNNPLPDAPRNRTGLVIHRVQALALTPLPKTPKPRKPAPPVVTKAVRREPMPDWFKDHFRGRFSTNRKEAR